MRKTDHRAKAEKYLEKSCKFMEKAFQLFEEASKELDMAISSNIHVEDKITKKRKKRKK